MIWACAVIKIAVLVGLPFAHSAKQDDTGPRWHGLFVACTDYPVLQKAKPNSYQSQIRLEGPAHDVVLLRDRLERVLVGEWASIVTLVGGSETQQKEERPTLRNIEGALRELARRDDLEGARVLLYFAGHGARQLDRNDDESDGLDEVFLAADADVARGGRIPGALTDDALARHVAKIRQAGASVWVVMDCCHASTGMRGDGPRHRGLSDDLLGMDPAAPRTGRRDRPDPLGADLEGIVAYYASESSAQTPELDLDEGDGTVRRHGLFTWALARELERSQPGETFDELFGRVEERCIESRAEGGTVPIAEGDVSLAMDGRGRGPEQPGWLQGDWMRGDAELERASRLRVDVVGDAPGVMELLGSAKQRAVRWRGAGADVTIDVTGTRVLLETPAASTLLDRSVLEAGPRGIGHRLGAIRLLNIARVLAGRADSNGSLTLSVEASQRGSGAFAPVGPGTRIAPGTRVRAGLSLPTDSALDLHALLIDGGFAAGVLFPRSGATERLARGGKGFLDLLGAGGSTVSEFGLGAETIVVLAFPRAMGGREVKLGSIGIGEGARGVDSALPRPWVLVRTARTSWPDIVIPWPQRAEKDALVAGLEDNAVVVVRPSPTEAPNEARIDLDGPGVRDGAPGCWQGERFDLVLRRDAAGLVALYDTDGDGQLDLELTDADLDGIADSFRERETLEWSAPRTVQLPLLELGHFGSHVTAIAARRLQEILSALCP